MKKKNIIVVGSANMDLIMRVSRLPKLGESLLGTNFMTARGGKGANQAVAAARLGANVTFVGCVGDDSFGVLQREGFIQEGICVDHLKTSKNEPTGTASILLTESGQNTIVVAPSANYDLLPEDITGLYDLFAQADMIMVQLEIPEETVETVFNLARETHTFSILDPSPARAVSPELLADISLVSPNETEAESLTGVVVDSLDTAREAAHHLRDSGVAQVVIKLGGRGCLYCGDEELYIPAFEVEARDVTAAGDSFTAALGVAWGAMSLHDTLCFANAAGALAATVEGAQPSIPDRDTVLHFLKGQAVD